MAVFYFYWITLINCFFLLIDSYLTDDRWFNILIFFYYLSKALFKSNVFFSKLINVYFKRSFIFLRISWSYFDVYILFLTSYIFSYIFKCDSFIPSVEIDFDCYFNCNVPPSIAFISFFIIKIELVTSFSYFFNKVNFYLV